ncbi:glycosyltransferase [Cohnella sp.]|uniref:glycosyltransferase n=1 Tax=Cohnella sp. TaxID=1883426 RepID=UPI003568725F
MPTISVLMSVYNGEEFLKESIDSILNQTYEDFEFVIVDDGSTDSTIEIIESYSDKRIKAYQLKENKGVSAALQYGLSKINGKYIAKADADDIYLPARLQKQKEYLDSHKDLTLVKTLIEYFPHDEAISHTNRYKDFKAFREQFKNTVVSTSDIAEKLYWTCCIPHATIMANAQVVKKIGYDTSLRMGEDYKLFYLMNKSGYKMGTVNEVLTHVRVSANSLTVKEHSSFWNTVYKIKEQEIRALFENGNKVYLWGAGAKGESVFNFILPRELVIHGFIDSDLNKQSKGLNGIPVFSPDILLEGDKVIITSQPGLYAIGEQLKGKGFAPLEDFIGFF